MTVEFPVLWPHRRSEVEKLEALGCPRSVPWAIVAPHEEQARRNHGQSLTRLAERGGLSPAELVAVLTDRSWRDVRWLLPETIVALLDRILREAVA